MDNDNVTKEQIVYREDTATMPRYCWSPREVHMSVTLGSFHVSQTGCQKSNDENQKMSITVHRPEYFNH